MPGIVGRTVGTQVYVWREFIAKTPRWLPIWELATMAVMVTQSADVTECRHHTTSSHYILM